MAQKLLKRTPRKVAPTDAGNRKRGTGNGRYPPAAGCPQSGCPSRGARSPVSPERSEPRERSLEVCAPLFRAAWCSAPTENAMMEASWNS